MNLAQQVHQAFSAGGVLAHVAEQFSPREGQRDMAVAVAQAIATDGALVVEAGTGVGKTFAYLVPALLSGKRFLVSTATKTLQDQLFGRDLPLLLSKLGLPMKIALLKGRGSYLCLERLESARQAEGLPAVAALRTLSRIEKWAQATTTGDLASLPGLDERSPVLPYVTSTRENCLGSECPKYRACFVNLARREALAADVVVVNHHLFFADLSVRESGMAEILPTVDLVIMDEAHQINETGIQFLGLIVSSSQLLDFCSDLLAEGLQHARGLADWNALCASIEYAARDLRMHLGRREGNTRLRWTAPQPEGIAPELWESSLAALTTALSEAGQALRELDEAAIELTRLSERAMDLLHRVNTLALPCPPDAVRWVDLNQQFRLTQSPLDIAPTMRQRVWTQGLSPSATAGHAQATPATTAAARGNSEPPRRQSWVFTSATLGDDAGLTWFVEACGLEAATVARVASPFDYASQSGVYVSRDFPEPNDPQHGLAVAELAARAARVLGGRTMVLTTTLRALQIIGEAMQTALADLEGIEVLVQGNAPKRELIERFRDAGQVPGRGAVLVGSASFWEGVDIAGAALQAVVIDKLPFPPPHDPLVQARSNRLTQQGKNPFQSYYLAEAAVALKQGAGRLIRHETDLGVLIVGDRRLATMSYGPRLRRSLPPMRDLPTEAELMAFLELLNQAR